MWDKSQLHYPSEDKKKKVLMETQSMRNKAYKVAKSIHKNFSRLSALGLVVLETVSLSDGTKITSYEHGVFQSLLIPLSDAELLFFPSVKSSLKLYLEVSFQFYVILERFKLLDFTLSTCRAALSTGLLFGVEGRK